MGRDHLCLLLRNMYPDVKILNIPSYEPIAQDADANPAYGYGGEEVESVKTVRDNLKLVQLNIPLLVN